ncbi:MAG: HBL/NHE enterotoxin family protein [Byssovorax sp.]
MSDINGSITGLSATSKTQSSQALLVQSYCTSILEQPKVDFSGFSTLTNGPQLVAIGTQINAALATAQDHANNYMSTIQPAIITNISNIGNWCALTSAIPVALPSGSTPQQWTDALNALSVQSGQFQTTAQSTAASLTKLNSDLSRDSASFTALVSQLNALVSGDGGALADIQSQINSIQSKIDGAIAGIVLSGLAIAGGLFLVAVGGVAEFVTAGTSTPVVAGGIAIVAAGIGGEVASALTLASLNSTKAKLYTQQASLRAEVQLASGLSGAYTSFNDQVKTAADAATQMSNAWNFLASDLSSLTTDLKNGAASADTLRTLFLTAANTVAQKANTDVTTIKQQMTGVTTKVAPRTANFSDFILTLAPKQAA